MNGEAREYNTPDFVFGTRPSGGPGEAMPAKVGDTAPDFEAPTLNGDLIRLSEFRDKRHVVLMTGAITSPMCAIEIPAMNHLQAEFDGQGVSFYPRTLPRARRCWTT